MGPYIFACQMLQNPQADETQGFKAEWLKFHDGFTRTGMNVYLLFDPAGAKNKKADYTAGWVIGLGPDRNVYVLDMVRDRLNLSQRAALVMRWHRKWKPMGVRYEKYGLMADIEHIKDVQQRENYRFEVTEVGGQLPKLDRIKRLIPYFEQGRVYLPRTHYYTPVDGRTSDLVQDFIEQEYKPFPVPIHDDMLDAFARLVDPDPALALVWPESSDYAEALEPDYAFDD
jgi:predicted phage terminase large subunit-like protein